MATKWNNLYVGNLRYDTITPPINGNIITTTSIDTFTSGDTCVLTNDPLAGGAGLFKGLHPPYISGNSSPSIDPLDSSVVNYGRSCCLDSADRLFVTGNYLKTITFDVTHTSTGGSSYQAALGCSETAGPNPSWLWSVADTDSASESYFEMATCYLTHLYVTLQVVSGTANIGGNMFATGAHILKYVASSGLFVTSFTVSTTALRFNGICIDQSNGDIVTLIYGAPDTTIVFGSAVTQLASNQYVISRCNSAGTLIWSSVATVGTTTIWSGLCLAIDQTTGSVYVGGRIDTNGTVTFGSQTATNTRIAFATAILLKFDNTGTCQFFLMDPYNNGVHSAIECCSFYNNNVYFGAWSTNNSFTLGGITVSGSGSYFGVVNTSGIASLIKNNTAETADIFWIASDPLGNIYVNAKVAVTELIGSSFGLLLIKYDSAGTYISNVHHTGENGGTYFFAGALTSDYRAIGLYTISGETYFYPYYFTNVGTPMSAGFTAFVISPPSINYTYAPLRLLMAVTSGVPSMNTEAAFAGSVTVPIVLTVGDYYYYNALTGTITTTIPSYAFGNPFIDPSMCMKLGYAISSNTLFFDPPVTTINIP